MRKKFKNAKTKTVNMSLLKFLKIKNFAQINAKLITSIIKAKKKEINGNSILYFSWSGHTDITGKNFVCGICNYWRANNCLDTYSHYMCYNLSTSF